MITIFPGLASGPCPTFKSSTTVPPATTFFLGVDGVVSDVFPGVLAVLSF